jgi:hypothetical protein
VHAVARLSDRHRVSVKAVETLEEQSLTINKAKLKFKTVVF